WDDALNEAERLLRDAGTHAVTALSGSETVEQAYALGKLMRIGLGAHTAMLPEPVEARALDGFRRPLSSIRDADLVVLLGDEPVANPAVRALADQAEHVLAIAMFERPARALADVVLPGTSYLERDGTYVNLEGRVQRLRRAVLPPTPDEVAWISKLAERFG